MPHNESNPFPLVEGAVQIKRHATVVVYLVMDETLRKGKVQDIFQFPEGEAPSYPRMGEEIILNDKAFAVVKIQHSIGIKKGIYTHFISLMLKPAVVSSPGISSN